MARVKGADIIGLRKVFAERGCQIEDEFKAKLNPEQQEMYTRLLPSMWVPVEDWLGLLTVATKTLFPNERQPWVSLGRSLAEKSYGSVYRVFLRVPTVKVVISRAAAIWNTYYDTGQVRATSTGPKLIELVVEDFPELPFEFREAARGHVLVLLELTGAQPVAVRPDYANPSSWRWEIEWR